MASTILRAKSWVHDIKTDPDNLYIDGNLNKKWKVSLFSFITELNELYNNTDIRKRTWDGWRAIGILNAVLWSTNIIITAKQLIKR